MVRAAVIVVQARRLRDSLVRPTTHWAGGNARDEHPVTYILRYNCPCRSHAPRPHCDSWKDNGPSTEPTIVANFDWRQLMTLVPDQLGPNRKPVVSAVYDAVRSDQHIVANRNWSRSRYDNSLVNEHVLPNAQVLRIVEDSPGTDA